MTPEQTQIAIQVGQLAVDGILVGFVMGCLFVLVAGFACACISALANAILDAGERLAGTVENYLDQKK